MHEVISCVIFTSVVLIRIGAEFLASYTIEAGRPEWVRSPNCSHSYAENARAPAGMVTLGAASVTRIFALVQIKFCFLFQTIISLWTQ